MMPEPELTSLPPRLLRFYRSEDRKYADALVVEGRLRLSQLTTYQRLEDPSRNDRDEGEGRLRVPGDVPVVHMSLIDGGVTDGGTVPGHFNFSTTWVQPLYVFCTSLPDVSLDLGRARFGPELVEFHAPARFAAELARSADRLTLDEREILWVEGFPVRYDKDGVSALPLDQSERSRLPYGQKSSRFQVEAEYRFVVALSGPSAGAPPFLELQLREPESFCRYCLAGV
jgi:hypothetical protein